MQCNPYCRVFDHTVNSKTVLLTGRKNFLVIAELSQQQREKRGYLRPVQKERRQFYETNRLQEENKLDMGEDRMSQRMRKNQKIRTDC